MEPGLTYIIADDEPPARERLLALLAEHPSLTLGGEASSGTEALALASQSRPQVAFLDIEMPAPKGLDLGRQLLSYPVPPALVFLTASPGHAVEAYDLGALDYLVKPIRRDRLAKTVARILNARSHEDRWNQLIVDTMKQVKQAPERVTLRNRQTGEREVITLQEVEWFTSQNEQTYAQYRGKLHEVQQSLARLQVSLADENFFRCHRAFLVNLGKVKKIVPWFHGSFNLVLESGSEVPLSRSYVAPFQEKLPGL